MKYEDFLATKSGFAPAVGFEPVREINTRLFPFQRDLVRWALRQGRSALFADTGLGKGHPVDELVLTPSGWRVVGDLVVGDKVIGSNGRPCAVTGVYHRGVLPVFRVSFNDGSSVRVDGDHLWQIRTTNDRVRGKPWRVMKTAALAAAPLRGGDVGRRRKWEIPLVKPVDFGPSKSLPVDPYILGVLLGDGCLSGDGGVLFVPGRSSVARAVEAVLPCGLHLHSRSCSKRRETSRVWSIVSYPHYGPNRYLDSLRELGVMGCKASEKFVPDTYLRAPVRDRLALLQGLLDTDGYLSSGSGQVVQFSSASTMLADAVEWLVRSLGGTTRRSLKEKPIYTYKGERRVGQPSHILTLAMPDQFNPFRARAAGYQPRKLYTVRRFLDAIEPAGEAKVVCISVDAPDQLYVTKDFIVTHNTASQLEWASQVVAHAHSVGLPTRVLVLAPLAVGPQTVRESHKFGIDGVSFVRDQSEVPASGIVVTNYERLSRFDAASFAGVVTDESGILKNYTGATKRALVEQLSDVPYKLACTATPAPNDHIELGNHAEYLGVMSSHQMLARWFINDQRQAGAYRLKGHAVEVFWDWVTSWSRCVGRPSDIGPYDDSAYILPPLEVQTHHVDVDIVSGRAAGELFRQPALSATSLHREKRRTSPARARRVADLVTSEPDEPWIVWVETNYDADAVMSLLPHAVEVRGNMSPDEKARRLLAFTDEGGIIVTKAGIAGMGLNWQHCARQAFCGLSYSYERYYQCIRRSWRFGQSRPVEAHVVLAVTEAPILDVIERKASDHEAMKAAMFAASRRAAAKDARPDQYHPKSQAPVPAWLESIC